MTECCSVQFKGGVANRGLSLYDERFVPGLTRLAEAIHAEGAKLGVQLFYDGAGFDYAPDDTPKIGPSDLSAFNGPQMRPMDVEEIDRMAMSFGQAASLAVRANVDLVEVHMAHGHLLGRFLSPHFNLRRDRYGGSVEKRLRFPSLVVESVRASVGSQVPVTCRLSLSERLPDGMEIDEAIEVVQALVRVGIDAVHVSVGTGTDLGRASIFPTCFSDEAPFAPLAGQLRRETGVRVIFAGKVVTADRASDLLRTGVADFVSVGRSGIADPEWANHALGLAGMRKVVPCVSCNQGCVDHLLQSREITCTVNPWVGFESEHARVGRASKTADFVIAGAGIAGLVLAMTLSRRGGRVTVFEQRQDPGGQYRWAGIAPGKEQYEKYLEYVLSEVTANAVQIVTDHAISKSDVAGLPTSHVYWAGGATPREWVPDGLAIPTMMGWSAFHQITSVRGVSVAVVGAGQVGCDLALWIASQGASVTLIDQLSQPISGLGARRHDYLAHLMARQVRLQFDSRVVAGEGNRLLWLSGTGESGHVEADLAVMALGRLAVPAPHFLAGAIGLGDCLRPTNALEAIRQATFHGSLGH
jgi:2,4-dienoyl-CoA reductase-like NADH-dependent reductase (Old Yellow Enzyme family)